MRGLSNFSEAEVRALYAQHTNATGQPFEEDALACAWAVVKAQGAHHVLDSSAPLREAVRGLTGGRGVDVVFDGVGGDLSAESLRCDRFGAR